MHIWQSYDINIQVNLLIFWTPRILCQKMTDHLQNKSDNMFCFPSMNLVFALLTHHLNAVHTALAWQWWMLNNHTMSHPTGNYAENGKVYFKFRKPTNICFAITWASSLLGLKLRSLGNIVPYLPSICAENKHIWNIKSK